MKNLPLLFLALAFALPSAIAEQPQERIQLIGNPDTQKAELHVDIKNGQVALSDVFRAVARFRGYDDNELNLSAPRAHLPMDSKRARWSIAAINRILKPCVSVRQVGDSLAITVDRKSSRNWVNSRKAEVRWAWNKIDWRSKPPTYGVERLEQDRVAADDRDIVLMIHGLNSRPEDLTALVPVVESSNLHPMMLRYPNDQPIDVSAKFLASKLRELAKEFPNRKVRLLTHSMGGLVARGAVETDLDPGNVSQLIMIAPPSQGSSLARVATFMDCHEFFTSSARRRGGVLIESVSDGLGEATADLSPNSVFLDQLNRRPRNANVKYTIALGTAGPMEEQEMHDLRKRVREYSSSNRFTRFAASKLNRALEQLDEVVQGKGDGVVSCQRGRLDGVRDTVELPFSHAGILHPQGQGAKEVYQLITDRLTQG